MRQAATALFRPFSVMVVMQLSFMPRNRQLVRNDHSSVPAEFKSTGEHGGKRTPLTAAISKDDGKTWINARNLLDDPDGWCCYTAIHFVHGSVPLAFASAGPGMPRLSKMHLARLPVKALYESAK
jgi:hypothetical protein